MFSFTGYSSIFFSDLYRHPFILLSCYGPSRLPVLGVRAVAECLAKSKSGSTQEQARYILEELATVCYS